MPEQTLEVVREVVPDKSQGAAALLKRSLPVLALALLGFGLLFWPALRGLVRDWARDPDFSHGFLIPPICAGILFAHRRQLALVPVSAQRSGIGLSLLLASILIFFAGYWTFTEFLQRLGLVGALLGGVLFVFGSPLLRAEPFPFCFLFFAIPPPNILLGPVRLALKAFATRISSELLLLTGIQALPEGNVLAIGEHRFEVADACSGIRSLMAITAAAVLFAYFFRTGVWKGLLLAMTAIPVTIAVNVLRIILVAVALTSLEVDLTEGWQHQVLGLAVFGISLGLLYVSWRFYEWFFRWKALPRIS